MNFDLDDTQRDFAAAARDFFGDQVDPEQARALLDSPAEPAPGRKALAELGFYGITVPESAGGIERSLLDLAVVAEQAGRVLAGPSLVTAARAAVLLEGDGDRLAALADGSTAFAVLDGSPDASAPSLDALDAAEFLALDGDTLVVGPGRVTAAEPIDATRRLGSVRLTGRTELRRDARALWERARQVAAVVLAAEDLGSAERALEIGVEYSRTRETFGRAIGSYQAVKHRLVDTWVGVDQLRSLVWWAAWAADNAPGELPLAASAAKAYSARVLEEAAETLVQVHGGIGFTWEHDAHLYWRRAKVDRLVLGDEAEHLDRVATAALAGAGG
ncbi:acyl-CoA dehydrogenase family protein [Streptomyces sp. BV129]|uniref:acyl-CoA dehydrogenase family protein n=1 Tax=Streptomyces sp. BV129 TaxID=2849671 RepID=UPI001C2EEE9C|nr:acyl-CoA dehydrogenase family protein [Streptomyces sp. BV129]MBV1949046.1 acyl-CoA/acyl-ACP dehydrogenase [Streptomyces sp. BV129]